MEYLLQIHHQTDLEHHFQWEQDPQCLDPTWALLWMHLVHCLQVHQTGHPPTISVWFYTSGAGAGSGSSWGGVGSTVWCLKPVFQKQFWMMVGEVSLHDVALIFVACTMSRALRRELASLLFSTQARFCNPPYHLWKPWLLGGIVLCVTLF